MLHNNKIITDYINTSRFDNKKPNHDTWLDDEATESTVSNFASNISQTASFDTTMHPAFLATNKITRITNMSIVTA